jgi:hypothetical protein
MSKITRRSYKRKKIVMGLALFGAIGLVSTGFAAWVLSASATDNQSADIKVGMVEENNMKFQNVKISGIDTNPESSTVGQLVELAEGDRIYSFNPAYNDNNGRVRFGRGAENKDIGERLSLKITGEINQAQNLDTLTITLDEVSDKIQEAVTKGYINLPVFDNSGDISYTIVDPAAAVQVARFEVDVAFTWGDTFGGVNPGVYYDEDVNGKLIGIDEVQSTLEDMHSLLDSESIAVTLVAMPN